MWNDFNVQVGRIFSWLVNLYPPSLSTETKRSCLGGFGGAAGSDTSRYLHGMIFATTKSKPTCHKMTSVFNPLPPTALLAQEPLVLWFLSASSRMPQLEKRNQPAQPSHSACSTLSETHANPSLDDLRCLIREAVPSTSLSMLLPSNEF